MVEDKVIDTGYGTSISNAQAGQPECNTMIEQTDGQQIAQWFGQGLYPRIPIKELRKLADEIDATIGEVAKAAMGGVQFDAKSSPQRVADNSDNIAPPHPEGDEVGCNGYSLIDCPFCGAPPCKLNIAHYGDVVTCGGTDSWCAGKDLRIGYERWNRRPQPCGYPVSLEKCAEQIAQVYLHSNMDMARRAAKRVLTLVRRVYVE